MDYFCTFDVFKIIPKNTCYFPYTTFKPFLMYIEDMTLKLVYIEMCAIGQIVLEFSLMWIRVTCLLAFHMPWDHLDLNFHYPIEALYKEPFGYIEEEELKSKKIIVHCCRSFLYLSLHPFIPWSTLCSSQAWLCVWDRYQGMEDWGGGGLGFSVSQTCRQRLSLM